MGEIHEWFNFRLKPDMPWRFGPGWREVYVLGWLVVETSLYYLCETFYTKTVYFGLFLLYQNFRFRFLFEYEVEIKW